MSLSQTDGFVDYFDYILLFFLSIFFCFSLHFDFQFPLDLNWRLLSFILQAIERQWHLVQIKLHWNATKCVSFHNGNPQWDSYPWPWASSITTEKQRPELNIYISQMENEDAAAQSLSKEKPDIDLIYWHDWLRMTSLGRHVFLHATIAIAKMHCCL